MRPSLGRAALFGAMATVLAGALVVQGRGGAGAQSPLTASYNGTPFTTAAIAVGDAAYVPITDLATALKGKVVADGTGAQNLETGTGAQPPAILASPISMLLAPRDLPAGYKAAETSLGALAFAANEKGLAAKLTAWGYIGGAQTDISSKKAAEPGAPATVESQIAQFSSARGASLATEDLEASLAAVPGGFTAVDTGYLGAPGQDGVVSTATETVKGTGQVVVYTAVFREQNVVCVLTQAALAGHLSLMDAWAAIMSQSGAILEAKS